MIILNILLFIVVLGVIIIIHEAGHFFFAKKAGILCHEFSIGMGPALWQKRKGETIYSIRGIPIGGYVSMAGESISDALIKKDQVIGIVTNEKDQITKIVLSENENNAIKGQVKDFDLYGKDFDPIYIDLEVNHEVKRYQVLRDAIYILPNGKEMWITPFEKSFESKTLWQRFLVIFAGPMMNFILAFFLFLIAGFFIGKPNLDSNELDGVAAGYSAEQIGLQEGDKIVKINETSINSWTDLSNVLQDIDQSYIHTLYFKRGDETYARTMVDLSVAIQSAGLSNTYYDEENSQFAFYKDAYLGQVFGRAKTDGKLQEGDKITLLILNNRSYQIETWGDIIQAFKTNPSGEAQIVYERDGKTHTAKYDLISEKALNQLGSQSILLQLGVTPKTEFNFGYSILYAPKKIVSDMGQVFSTIGLLLSPSENIGVGDLSGPVGIYSLVSQTASQGFISILVFTGFLSINIGLLNLLPIPALDGGRLVFLGIEAIRRKPLPRKIENTVNNAMFILLLVLFVFVTYNDILRLIAG